MELSITPAPACPPVFFVGIRLYSDEGFDSSKSVYTAKLKELTDLGEPIEKRMYEATNRQVRLKLTCDKDGLVVLVDWLRFQHVSHLIVLRCSQSCLVVCVSV